MAEPKYDEDVVNLGYLRKLLNVTTDVKSPNISKCYSSKPIPPYNVGDTWVDGSIIYTCIKSKNIGFYEESDWTTESGAKEVAEDKNRVFLSKPYNYKSGDMWILQSDMEHKAGKKGEILISVAGRKIYEENDWVNMLGYGTIRSINEIANNINDAIERLDLEKKDGKLTIFYNDRIPTNAINNDLWYVTKTIDTYIVNKVYKYAEGKWEEVKDSSAIIAFEEANEERIVGDGKIQIFYSENEPIYHLGVGDLWKNMINNNLYRYNGTNWLAVYDTNLKEIRKELETITETNTSIVTDIGKITQEVSSIETKVADLGYRDEVFGTTELYISNAGKSELLKLEIQGNKTYKANLFPSPDLYPSENLYPNMEGSELI